MTLLQAVLMGIIQGLTEFLPVSSSGHLAIFKHLFHVNTDTGLLFDVILHLGTLIAICVAFYKDIAKLIAEGTGILMDVFRNIGIFFGNLFGKEEKTPYIHIVKSSYRKFVMMILVSTIPTAIIGYLGRDLVNAASAGLLVPGICLVVTAALLLIADRCKAGNKKPKSATYLSAFSIGMAQGVATLPGLSRSGTTITACLLGGYEKKFAVKYSFIMSIPAVLGAVVLEIGDAGSLSAIPPLEIVYYLVGMLIAAIVGYICIKTMVVIVRNKKFVIFSIYCLAVGLLAICGNFFIK